MTLPSLDLYCVDSATVTEAVEDSRSVKCLQDSIATLATVLRKSDGFRDLVQSYVSIVKQDLQQSGMRDVEIDSTMMGAILTAGIRVGHAVAMRQLEAATGSG